ncbi:hypothetical protein OCAR_4162 [Afipia carboxidovorans OM5]|nr:hypothetical protein OCAR_4162 [Afipia carboxidovorans OM5]
MCRLSFDGHACEIEFPVDLLICLVISIVHPSLSGDAADGGQMARRRRLPCVNS